ncbi:MAG: nuclear transport factor 2 family protein [Betaproteobacteria bacterium]|nr:nuclear transport factor 2 family protein [Betaproteobacteria bacterium]
MNRPLFSTPEEAEAAFYEALEKGDLEAMMAIWAEDEEVVCIHPGGQRLTGHAQVRSGWQTIFAAAPRLTVRISDRMRWLGGMMAVHSLLETFFSESDPTPRGPVLATNVFVRGADGWRMLSHHASVAPETSTGTGDAPRVLH